MRRRLLLLALTLALPRPAAAEPEIPPGQDGGADRPTLLRFGAAFLPVAKAFGCANFRWAAFAAGKRSMTLEYLPEGARLEGWTRMLTVTVFPLPSDTATQQETMLRLAGLLLANYEKGRVLDQEHYRDAKGDPGLFVEYEIGAGPLKEHNAGALLRAGAASAAFVQIQTRGAAPDPKDAADMKLLAQHRLTLPGG